MMLLALTMLAVAPQHAHQHGDHPTPYAGLETRELRALSQTEVDSLRRGEGVGFALVAELGHFPGPKHVLELARELGLSDEQRGAVQAIFEDMRREAVRLGEELIEKEQELQELFAPGADPEALRALVIDVGHLRGELRWAHLAAHVRTREVLTTAQIDRYDQLRGYEH